MKLQKLFTLKLLIPLAICLSCQSSDYAKQVSKYPEIKISDSWSLRLPYELKKTGHTGKIYQRTFASSSDSIVLEVSTDTIDIKESLEYFNEAVEFEKRGEAPSPCLGSFEGYAKDYNYVDSVNMLSGLITDFEENGRWSVAFTVRSAKTGDKLSLGFEKVSKRDIKMIHEVIRSIRNF